MDLEEVPRSYRNVLSPTAADSKTNNGSDVLFAIKTINNVKEGNGMNNAATYPHTVSVQLSSLVKVSTNIPNNNVSSRNVPEQLVPPALTRQNQMEVGQ